MPYLSLGPDKAEEEPDTKVLAVVRSGDDSLDGLVLRLHASVEDEPTREAALPSRALSRLKGAGLHPRKAAAAAKALAEAVEDDAPTEAIPEPLRPAYEDARREGVRYGRTISLPSGAHFEPVPTPVESGRDARYLAAPPGAGKSHAAAQFARKYHAMWPSRKIWLFSKNDVASDPVWAPLIDKGWATVCNPDTLKAAPVDVTKDFGGPCLVIFDDLIDAYSHDRKMEGHVVGLVNDCLDLGRRHGISVLVLNHELTSYKRTRGILTSCHSMTVFPAFTPQHVLSYAVGKIGVNPKLLPQLRRMGRAIELGITAPQYALGTSECMLLE